MAEVMEESNCPRVSLMVLADELIDIILSYKLLDYRDLCRFAQVCVRFSRTGCYNEVWKKKAQQRWKQWKNLKTVDNWKKIFKQRFKTEAIVIENLEKFCKQFGSKADVCNSELKKLTYLMSDSEYADYWKCTLEESMCGDESSTNLTHKYYSEKLYAFFQRCCLRKELETFMKKSPKEQSLEEGSLLIAKWIDEKNYEDSDVDVQDFLNRIALRVKCVVNEDEPNVMGEQSSQYIQNNPQRCLRLLEGLKQVMFTEEKFSGNSQDYYNVKNSLLPQVLKRKQGIPITLAVVFAVVAKRLGVEVEPVNFPHHFLLRWCSNQASLADPSVRYTYIDAFNDGRFYTQDECIDRFASGLGRTMPRASMFQKASPSDILTRMVTNIVNIYHTSNRLDNGLRSFRNALELLLIIKPNDIKFRSLLAQVNLHLGINLDETIQALQEQLSIRIDDDSIRALLERAQEQKTRQDREKDDPLPVRSKLRTDPQHKEVKFRVGTVMSHSRYHYGCVIYGWDYYCDMNEAWIHQMGVDRLPNGRNQAFYNVLGDDGSSRYAAQENLIEARNQPFNPHPDIGKYFRSWQRSSYVPNEYLAQMYPEDN